MVSVEFLYGITANQLTGRTQLLHSPVSISVLALPECQTQLGPLLTALFL